MIFYKFPTPMITLFSSFTAVSKTAQEENYISVHPNPASNYTTINIQNFLPNENWSFKLYDATGKIVRARIVQNNSFILEKANLSSGIYFYQIENSTISKSYTGKIILE